MIGQILSWTRSRAEASQTGRRKAARRGKIGAVELLEDRTLLSATPHPRIVNGTPTSSFPSVGLVGDVSGDFCSGTLIAPDYVLTAGHCSQGVSNTAGRFTVGGRTYSTSQVILNPGYNGNLIGTSDNANDLALFHLSQSVTNVSPSPIFRGTPHVGDTLTLVGFGSGGTGSGHNGDFGIKRVGTTPIDQVTAKRILWRFDNNSESNTAPGDSGGPAFLEVGGVYDVAAVTSGGTNANAGIGDNSFDTRVDAYASWIDSVIGSTPSPNPNPSPGLSQDDHVNEPDPDATVISLDSSGSGHATGLLEQAGDRDVFKISVTSQVAATIGLTAADGSLDMYLRLYDSTGRLIAENDDVDSTTDSRLSRTISPGVYYILAGSFNDAGAGSYAVDIRTTIDDYGDSFSDATRLAVTSDARGSVAGNVNFSGDHDFFKFTAPRGRTTVLTLTATSGGLDTVLAGYNAQGRRIASNDDYGGTDSRVQFSTRVGQTYFVEASGYGSSSGGYKLELNPPLQAGRSIKPSVISPKRDRELVLVPPRRLLADMIAERFAGRLS